MTSLRAVQILCGRGAGVGWLILQHIHKNRVAHPSRLGLPRYRAYLSIGVLEGRPWPGNLSCRPFSFSKERDCFWTGLLQTRLPNPKASILLRILIALSCRTASPLPPPPTTLQVFFPLAFPTSVQAHGDEADRLEVLRSFYSYIMYKVNSK